MGHLLPQEKFDRKGIYFPGFELGIEEDEPQGTSQPVGAPESILPRHSSFLTPFAGLIFFYLPSLIDLLSRLFKQRAFGDLRFMRGTA